MAATVALWASRSPPACVTPGSTACSVLAAPIMLWRMQRVSVGVLRCSLLYYIAYRLKFLRVYDRNHPLLYAYTYAAYWEVANILLDQHSIFC